jgi:predicted amidophosphoribosyltransferase
MPAQHDVKMAEAPLCAGCAEDYFNPQIARCRRCALPLPGASVAHPPAVAAPPATCGACLRAPPWFDAAVAAAHYAAPVDGMVLAMKFGRRLDLAHVLGCQLGRALLAQHRAPARLDPAPLDLARLRLAPLDLAPLDPALLSAESLSPAPLDPAYGAPRLVPVPLAFERHAARGFNQSLEIARPVARLLGVPLAPRALLRVRHASPQESLDLDARRTNVRGAFVATGRLDGAHVLLVDDVMTSGSTLNDAARAARAAGARRITALVVCRTA